MTAIGSLTLMLRQEARINWRMMTTRMSHKAALWSLIGFLVLWHLVALPVPFMLAEMPPVPRLDMLAAMSGVGVFGLIMMLPFALLGTVRLIYSRGDMDLLLSSPLPPHAIIVARVLAIAFGLFATAGVFILPAANMGAFANPRALMAYVALGCIALTATALGVLIAQGLFALLGARRTRLIAQIVGAMMVLVTLCLANLHNILSAPAVEELTQRITNLAAHVPAVESWVWWPARAALGEPLPFLVVTSLCLGLFLLTTYGLANRLIANAVAANGSAERTVRMRSSSRAMMSQRGPVAVVRRKEWLLIGRDPWLMTQIAQQLLLMVPTIFIVWKASSVVLRVALPRDAGGAACRLARLAHCLDRGGTGPLGHRAGAPPRSAARQAAGRARADRCAHGRTACGGVHHGCVARPHHHALRPRLCAHDRALSRVQSVNRQAQRSDVAR